MFFTLVFLTLVFFLVFYKIKNNKKKQNKKQKKKGSLTKIVVVLPFQDKIETIYFAFLSVLLFPFSPFPALAGATGFSAWLEEERGD